MMRTMEVPFAPGATCRRPKFHAAPKSTHMCTRRCRFCGCCKAVCMSCRQKIACARGPPDPTPTGSAHFVSLPGDRQPAGGAIAIVEVWTPSIVSDQMLPRARTACVPGRRPHSPYPGAASPASQSNGSPGVFQAVFWGRAQTCASSPSL
eukprot:355943-Chlamydomonas_euryale.AAC.16